MCNFAEIVSPERMAEISKDLPGDHSVARYTRLAKKRRRCQVCGQPAWRLGDSGLCFTCTTGESDASDDYELVQL